MGIWTSTRSSANSQSRSDGDPAMAADGERTPVGLLAALAGAAAAAASGAGVRGLAGLRLFMFLRFGVFIE